MKTRSLWQLLTLMLLVASVLPGCIFSSESQQARETTERFWQAVLEKDMDTAKNLVTWDSTPYLQFLGNKSLAAQRFETGEIKVEETVAEVATLLYGGEKGDLLIPVRTVLVRSKDQWQVDVQKTMGSMVSGTMGAIVEQLDSFMQNGLKDLDQSLSDSVGQLSNTLKKGLQQLEKELNKPLPAPVSPPSSPDRQVL